MPLPTAITQRLDPRIKTAWADAVHRARWFRFPVRRVTRAFVRRYGLTVQGGPFEGMRFPEYAVGRGELVVPQLLGAYEAELQPSVEAVIAGRYEQIVDIGGSDGYYGVGFALACPESDVIVYEMNPFPARVCRALAEENGVAGRIDMRGECTVEELQALPDRRTFVLCDCEGAEAVLMDPERVPLLRSSAAIIELHDFAAPGIRQTVLDRFGPTHDIEIVETRQRHPADYPALDGVPGINYMDRHLAVAEFRPMPMSWAVLRPRGA